MVILTKHFTEYETAYKTDISDSINAWVMHCAHKDSTFRVKNILYNTALHDEGTLFSALIMFETEYPTLYDVMDNAEQVAH